MKTKFKNLFDLLLCLFFCLSFLSGCAAIKEKEEHRAKIKEQFPHMVYLRFGNNSSVLDSKNTNELIENISEPLRKFYGFDKNFPKIYIVPSMSMAAMATADNNIYVSIGVIDKSQTEDEIAAVIAHEMAHIKLEHTSSEETLNSIGWTVRAFGAIAPWVSAKYNKTGKQIQINMGLQEILEYAGASISHNSFYLYSNCGWSRSNELEADSLAVDALNGSGYKVESLEKILVKFPEPDIKPDKNVIFTALSGGTHPKIKERVEIINKKCNDEKIDTSNKPFKAVSLVGWKKNEKQLIEGIKHLIAAGTILRGPYKLTNFDELVDKKNINKSVEEFFSAYGVSKKDKRKFVENKMIDIKFTDKNNPLFSLYNSNYSRILELEIESRLSGNSKFDTDKNTLSILSDKDTPQDILMLYAMSLIKRNKLVESEKNIEQIQSQFGEQHMLFPLQLAVGMDAPGKPRDIGKNIDITSTVLAEFNGELGEACRYAEAHPEEIYQKNIIAISKNPVWSFE